MVHPNGSTQSEASSHGLRHGPLGTEAWGTSDANMTKFTQPTTVIIPALNIITLTTVSATSTFLDTTTSLMWDKIGFFILALAHCPALHLPSAQHPRDIDTLSFCSFPWLAAVPVPVEQTWIACILVAPLLCTFIVFFIFTLLSSLGAGCRRCRKVFMQAAYDRYTRQCSVAPCVRCKILVSGGCLQRYRRCFSGGWERFPKDSLAQRLQ
jgi:hypothetical protein